MCSLANSEDPDEMLHNKCRIMGHFIRVCIVAKAKEINMIF